MKSCAKTQSSIIEVNPQFQSNSSHSYRYEYPDVFEHRNRRLLHFIILIICLLDMINPTASQLTPNNVYINQFAKYVVQLTDFTTPIAAGSVVLVNFPKQFSPYQFQINKPYTGGDVTDSCPSGCGAVTVDCSGLTIILRGLYPVSGTPFFTYTIFNIKNPLYKVKTTNFTIQIRTPDYSTVLYRRNVTGKDYFAQPFTSILATLNNPYLWQTSDVTFDVAVPPEMDYFRMTFPTTRWQNQTLRDTPIITPASINSSLYPLSFTRSLQSFTIQYPQLFTSQTIRFTIKSINTPSSMQNMGQILFAGYNYQNQIIRESTYYIPASQLTYDQLRQLQSVVTYDQTNNLIGVRIKFKAPRSSITNDRIVITYPPEITISTNPSDYVLQIAGIGMSSSPTFPGGNVVQLTPFAGTIYQPEPYVTMTIPWPRTAVITSDFKIETYRIMGAGFSKMQQAQCCAIWIKQKPLASAVLTVPTNQRLASNVEYSFDITHSFSTLLPTDSIVIQFPSVYAMDSSKQSVVCPTVVLSLPSNSGNLNTPACSLSKNTLTLSNIFIASQSPTLLNIKVNLTNPSVTPNENFQVWSQDNSGAKIESNGGINIVITPATLNSVTINPSSKVTNAKSNYVIAISSIGTVVKNTIIKIIFPVQIRFIEYSITCQVDSIQQFCTYDSATSSIKILMIADLASTTFQVKVINLLNPQTVAVTSSFQVEIYDPAGNLVQNSTGLTAMNVKMDQTDNFLYTKMWMDAVSLDSKGNLNFILVTNYDLSPSVSYQIDITFTPKTLFAFNPFPPALNFQGSPLPISSSSNTTTETLISFVFTPSISKRIIQFQFSQFYIFQDQFTAGITLSKQIAGVYQQSVSTAAESSLQYGMNSILVNDYQVTQGGYFMNESPGTITLKINILSPNITFSSVVVNIPRNYQSASNTYQYTSPTNTTTVTFTIADLLNPTEVSQEPFTFLLYDSSNQIVAISQPSTQYFSPKCTFPCRDCKSLSQPALCVDCYQITSNSMIHFRETSAPYGICTDFCQQGEFLNVTLKKCMPCDTNCSSCVISVGLLSGDPQKCLTCPLSTYLHNYRCLSTCPDGYFANNLVCSACMANCGKCSALNTCSECVLPFVFYSGQCLVSCPQKTVATLIPSTARSQCQLCSANCLVCSTVTSCTLCANNFFLYNFVCLNACPFMVSQLYPDLNNACKPCQCQTCVGFSYNCTSCSPGLVYDSVRFRCLAKCEDGQYNSSGTCQNCPTDCLVCTSLTKCKICKQPNILYQVNSSHTQCLTQCPTSTLFTIQTTLTPTHILQCLPCKTGCSNCILSTNFCTQCDTGLVFYNNLCVGFCPVGYHNISNFCRKCVSECQQCDTLNPRNCSQCAQGYFLYSEFCYANCPQGTYPQTTLKKCLSCQPLCQTCLNGTHCTSCKSGYFLFPNNLCYDSCPTTPVFYYKYHSQCVACQPQCNGCLSSPVECVTCSSGYFYQNEDTMECSTTCAQNYFIKNDKCIKCQSPCELCDTTYNSCVTCYQNSTLQYVYEGNCLSQCPIGFYPDTVTNSTLTIYNKCLSCSFPCQACTKSQCLICQSFAFMYKNTCVLKCQDTVDMPYQKDTYCTNCLSIPFCTFCEPTEVNEMKCWACTYPYVLFMGECLNQCPNNYELIDESIRVCQQSAQYIAYKQKIYQRNKPSLPFIYLIVFAIVSVIVYPIAKLTYPYTYHIGYLIFLINLLDYALVYNWLLNQNSKYEGEFFDGQGRLVPLYILIVGLGINLVVLGWIGFSYVIKEIYLKDVRYQEWKQYYRWNFWSVILLLLVLGLRSHKLYYSKLFGLQNFSFRIISVQKFHLEDRINLLICFGDLLIITAFFIIAYNIFIEYSVLYLTALEILCIKLLTWTLLIFDSKKPDRGFFYGDEKVALEEIQKEEEQHLSKLRRVDTDHLIKMIRQKSACLLTYDHHPFGQIQKAQFMSVYNPDDYQDVPQVPLKKIPRNIQKGKFRKGRKITIEEKLQRFADSIKPKPKIAEDSGYLNGLIYWKPPKKIKNTKEIRVEPMSEESMLKILEDKEMKYKEELDEIENIIFSEKDEPMHNFRTGQFFYRKNDRLNIDSYDHLDDSNHSIQEFEDLSSQVFKPMKDEIEYNDLMNLNYAKKKHLPVDEKKPSFDENQMRILYHQPMKRRVSRLKK